VAEAPSTLVDALVSVLSSRPEVLDAYLFGSQAAATRPPPSDVDVAVYIDRAQEPETRYGYRADLGAALGAATGRRDIDVVVLNDAPPLLYHRAIAGGRRIFARDLRAATTREGRALSRYCDYLPQLRLVDAALRARLARGTFGR
jgi:predicted nucleotidyltransferase